MFDDIFFAQTAGRYRAAPLVEQRERYLVHLKATGARRSTLRKCANDQLSLVRLLDLADGDRVSRSQIEAAAVLWAQPNGRRCDQTASPKTRDRFVSHGLRWLAFLGWQDGTRLASSTVQAAFDKLRHVAGVHRAAGGRTIPRLHDFRHSFAVHRLTSWYRQGADVQRLLPVLSTYLGHADLEGTKVYLSMTPELLEQASLRFARYAEGGRHV